jgi:hypothetical protein
MCSKSKLEDSYCECYPDQHAFPDGLVAGWQKLADHKTGR